MIHCFIACSVEVICIVTVIILENMFWNIKSAVFTYEEIQRKGNSAVELACLQMLSISQRKIYIYLFTLFFYLGFLSQPFTNHRATGEGRRHFFNPSLPLRPASPTLRHQPGDYSRELTSADKQQADSNREPLVSKRKLLTTRLEQSQCQLIKTNQQIKNIYIHTLNEIKRKS